MPFDQEYESNAIQKSIAAESAELSAVAKYEKRNYVLGIIRTVLLSLFTLLFVILAVVLLKNGQEIGELLTDAKTKIEAINGEELTAAVNKLSKAANDLSSTDPDSIRSAVSSLDKAAENLSKVDMNNLNELVAGLTDTVDTLNSVVAALRSIFGR